MGPYLSQNDYWESGAKWIVLLMYLPSVAMVLWRRNIWCDLPVLTRTSEHDRGPAEAGHYR